MPKEDKKTSPKTDSKKTEKTPQWIRDIAMAHDVEKEGIKIQKSSIPTPQISGNLNIPSGKSKFYAKNKISDNITSNIDEINKIRGRLKEIEELKRKDKEDVKKIEDKIQEEESKFDSLLKSIFGN